MSLTLIEELGKLAYRQHFWVDMDNWYSCPKAPEGCADDQFPKDVCNCGADEHNAKVDALLAKLREGHHQGTHKSGTNPR